jgi:DNA repair protein RadA/Sms
VVVDSVQTLYSDSFTSAPGSVSQVREAAGRFLRLAKDTGAAVFLVGHVTKEGAIAGPRVLEHMVDTVLQFEGDRYRFYRTLRAAKNRFGSTNELGIFEMTGSGLKTVPDPSALFLSDAAPAAGSVVHVAVEGTRCFLVEVQALVNQTELAMPRRVAVGFDRNRLAMLVAVLGRHAGVKLSSYDVFVTIAGGIRIDEPAADLAVALAIASAQRDTPFPAGAAVFGEISLTGSLRSCSQSERRTAEARRAGFDRVVVPSSDARRAGGGVAGVADLRGAFAATLGDASRSASGATNDEWGV